MVSKDNIRKKIFHKSVSLKEYGLNDLAWEKSDAIDLIKSLLDDDIGILGGDVYSVIEGHFRPIGDNWYCEIGINEPVESFYKRSKRESIKYLERYLEGVGFLFSITFTDYYK